MHHNYMIIISALFAAVFVIILLSMIKHRRSSGAGKFFGPTGGIQWFWALVPLVILGFVNMALISVPEDQVSAAPKKIELATAPTPTQARR